MSRVTCHVSHFTIFFLFFFGQSGEAFRSRVCYQRGLPRLVYRNVLKSPRGQEQLDYGFTHLSIEATLVTIDLNLHQKIKILISRVE